MSSIPSQLARVPNLMASNVMLGSLHKTNQSLLHTQIQLASGKAVNRPSDNAVSASAISLLDDSIERRDQRLRNLSHAEAVMGTTDAALADAADLMLEAKEIGLSQIGAGSDSETRENQAKIIESILDQMIAVGNRKYQQVHLFGGETTSREPMVEQLNGIRYQGTGKGMHTDLGMVRSIPVTMSGADAFGALSARVEGDRDLGPEMVPQTRLEDLRGARGQGVTPDVIRANVDGAQVSVDLSNAHTVEDVVRGLEEAIQTVDPDAEVRIDPASGTRFEIQPGNGVEITISDPGSEAMAADLGLTEKTFTGPTGGVGGDVDPKLTDMTPVGSLIGVDDPPGMIRISNGGQQREVDLSEAETVQDIKNIVAGLDMGVRVEIAGDGDRFNFINELSGGAMSISEVAGGDTAEQLGVRSLTGSTKLSEFNNGLGVQIKSGAVDPVTGDPDPDKDMDFEVVTKDGTSFAVDLAGAETVQDVLDRINDAADAEGLTVGTEFTAGLAADGNGIAITDNTTPAVVGTEVVPLNGSFAAQDLGLKGETNGATLTGEDRATVAVNSVFTHLMSLRDALKEDDDRGISLAVDRLEGDIDRVTQARADVGVRMRRVVDATEREEDLKIQDTNMRSQVQDLDYTEAAMRFADLQQQLQAGLTSASRISSISLLDFLR